MKVKKYMQRGERRMQEGDAAYILFNGYTYERKERRKRISQEKNAEQTTKELFNQQQAYYRQFILKVKQKISK